jgi:hypothetical protein
MDLKGYRLWAMGQLDSTCRAQPHHVEGGDGGGGVHRLRAVGGDEPEPHCSGASWPGAIESKGLKPGNHRFKVWVTRRLKLC